MKRRLLIIVLLGVILGKPCLASNNVTQVSRYLTVSIKPTLSQTDLLSQSVQVRFTRNIQTVGDAMVYLLNFSGYSLISENNMSPALKTTLSKPLPIVQRELGPVSLKEGLIVLAGHAFYLVQDPINRVVDFRLKPKFQKDYIAHKGKVRS